MLKKIITLCLIIICIGSLTACKKKEATVQDISNETVSVTESNNETTNTVVENTKETTKTSTTSSTSTTSTSSTQSSNNPILSTSPNKQQTTASTAPTETIEKIEDIIDYTIPTVEKPEEDFVAREEESNVSDSLGLSKFTYNGKKYDLLKITTESLKKTGVYLVENDSYNFVNNQCVFRGNTFGIKNKQGTLTPPDEIFYIDFAKDNVTIEAISVGKSADTNMRFFRGIKCGMTSRELAPLLKGSVQQTYRETVTYIFKDSKTSLMIETIDGIVTDIILIKNSAMKNWEFNYTN